MQIEEWRPPPAKPLPPPRKDRTVPVMIALGLGTFFITLGVLGRHELADYSRQIVTQVMAAKPKQPPAPPVATPKGNATRTEQESTPTSPPARQEAQNTPSPFQ